MSVTTVLGPGIHQLSAADYHNDPCPEPSLSSSIAKLLCLSSPAHARQQHRRLNPAAVEEESEKFDIGTAAHALLLEGDAGVAVLDFPDFRTKTAREARDAAHAAGKTPLLAKVWADVQAMVTAARAQLDQHTDGGAAMFRDGRPEQTLIWQEDDGSWGRARADWLRSGAIDDYKTTSGSANPENWTRAIFGMGFDIQASWYLRGARAITGLDLTFRFCVQETASPFALSVVGLGPAAMMLAEKKCLFALAQWRRCLDAGHWPGYPTRTCWSDLPAWEEARWLAKEVSA